MDATNTYKRIDYDHSVLSNKIILYKVRKIKMTLSSELKIKRILQTHSKCEVALLLSPYQHY